MAFKEGHRSDPQMSPMVGILDDKDMRNLADFYKFQTLVHTPVKTDPALVAEGKKLADTLACASCHKANYKGVNEISRPGVARKKTIW